MGKANPGTKPTGRKWLWIGAMVILAVAGALVLYGVFGNSGQEEEARPVTPVAAEAVAPYLFGDIIEAIGTARANESVILTAQVSDTVKKVHFTDGAKVKAGTILVTLNNAEEIAQVSEAVANYTEAQKQFDRTKPLVDKGTLSVAALDAAQRTLDEAKARLERARARAGDYVITAPFAGMLGLRNVSPGSLVSPGTQITTLDDISIIKLDFSVPEKFLSTLAPGQEISAHSDAYPGTDFRGVVKTVDSRVDPVTRAVTVRAEIPNPDDKLRPGMLLVLDLVSNLQMTLSVPEEALVPVGDTQYLFRIKPDSTVERLAVVTGRRYNGRVEILKGLKEGDKVVTGGTLRIRDGLEVKIQTETKAPPPSEELLSFTKQENADVPE